ncbi:MAG: hypothetical protein GYB68_06235 [Chloroflexi bacterium]|nr:hypothetical protein [Chloroflexota bacterium]
MKLEPVPTAMSKPLGLPVQHYPARSLWRSIWAAVLAVLGISGLIIALALLEGVQPPWLAILIGTHIVLILSVAAILLNHLRDAVIGVGLFQNGIEVQRAPGENHVLTWDEIEHLWLKTVPLRMGAALRQLVIHTSDGQEIILTDKLPGIADLRLRVAKLHAQHQLAAARLRVAQGEVLDFGPFRLSNAGLALHDEHFEWASMRSIKFEERLVSVHASDTKLHPQLTSDVSDVMLLAAFCAERLHPEQIDNQIDR